LHRDIKPGNIYIKSDGSPILIDFGATRYSIGVKSQSLSIILTPGYAPKEQYSSKSKQAPYTDIYAIGAVMYKMVTDATPIEASERANAITDDEPDPHIKLSEMDYPNYSDNFKKAIDWAMEFKHKDRPQSVRELQDAFTNEIKKEKATKKVQKSDIENRKKIEKPQPIMESNEKKGNSSLIIGFLVLALIIGGFFFIQNNKQKKDSDRESNYRVEQLEEQNRKLDEERRLAEEEALRVKKEAQREKERVAYEKAQEEEKVAKSKKIDFDEKNSLDMNNDNINLTLSYPVNVKRGNRIYIKASLKNNGDYESRGGVTLSFPQLSSISGRVVSNNFSTDIKTYGDSDKIWSKTTGGPILAKYLMVESNNEKWSQYEKHSFEVGIDTPNNISTFKIQFRAALKNRVVPGSGINDQQGYLCKIISVNIVD
jgi:serine/threonine protein kinase